MKIAFAALLTAVSLSISAYGADAGKAEAKRPPPKQTQKMSKPAELFAGTKKYLAKQASKTAEIIKVNAASIKKNVWPDAKASGKASTQEKGARKESRDQSAKSD